MLLRPRKNALLYIGSAAMLFISGCQEMMQKPQVQVVSLKYADITRASQTMGVQLQVRNANGFAIPIQSGSATITVDGQPFGEGAIPHAVTLPAEGTVNITVPVRVNVAVLKPDLPQILLEGKASYQVSGTVTMQNVNVHYPFKYQGVLTLSQVEKIVEHAALGSSS